MRREISLEESKEIQVKILKSIDSFCRASGIKYSLAAGSAIGAIRHKGFIPWDDDIDILMMRNDYNRFLSSYNDNKYRLLHYTTDCTWDNYFTCIEDPRTITFLGNSTRSTRGIWVSIFPVDFIPDDDKELEEIIAKVQKLSWNNSLIRLKRSYWTPNTSFIYNIAKLLCRTFLKLIPYRCFYSRIDKIIAKFQNIPTKRLASIAGWTFDTVFDYPADCFSDYIDVDFENMKSMLCQGYDVYLRRQYGDYMSLPPIEEQVPKHEATIYWKE